MESNPTPAAISFPFETALFETYNFFSSNNSCLVSKYFKCPFTSTNPGTQAIHSSDVNDHWGHSPKADTSGSPLLANRSALLMCGRYYTQISGSSSGLDCSITQNFIRNLTQFPHKPVFNCGAGQRCSLISWRILPSSPRERPGISSPHRMNLRRPGMKEGRGARWRAHTLPL